VTDFGLAQFHACAGVTRTGDLMGTLRYMSPEQALAKRVAVDHRTDIYSLGVILFEMLSGKMPYDATTPLGMALKHATYPVPRILNVNPNLPPGVEPIIEKVLAKERDERFSSGAEFVEAFVKTLGEPVPSHVSLPRPLPLKAEAQTVSPPTPELGPKIWPVSRFWLLVPFLILAIAGFTIWGFPSFAPTSSPTSTLATATVPPFTPTVLPTPTATSTPTEVFTPTIPPVLGVGGADKIALTANNDIYLLDVDGSHIRQLTNTNRPKFDLQWLAEGSELLYGEANCVYKINVGTAMATPEEVVCFQDPRFDGFRVSPDGKQVAISIERRLLVMPFDPEILSEVSSAFEIQNLVSLCLDYSAVAVKGARWSADGRALAIVYQSVIGEHLGDTVRVLAVDMERCQASDPLILDEFPARRFVPEGYERLPVLPSYHWDGSERFLFTSFKRNVAYGELYLYDISAAFLRKLNPIDSVCCYGSSIFSPDGTYILLVFQDVRLGAESVTQLYYLPLEEIGTGTAFTPIKLPLQFFPDLRERIQLALRPLTVAP
jgi:hypothetical protein